MCSPTSIALTIILVLASATLGAIVASIFFFHLRKAEEKDKKQIQATIAKGNQTQQKAMPVADVRTIPSHRPHRAANVPARKVSNPNDYEGDDGFMKTTHQVIT